MEPKISVILPAYNCEKYIRKAVESILNQSYENFELIIINDGSTDRTESIILSFVDYRIKYIQNEKNIGIVKSLNKGIELCEGKYIARMDADDISLRNRFELQLKYLENNNNYGICGSWYKLFGEKNFKTVKLETDSEIIKASLIFRNYYIAHPTVMIRKALIKNYSFYYQERDLYTEDYGLWSNMAKFTRITNIPKVLLKYRFLRSSLSRRNINVKKKNIVRIALDNLEKFGFTVNEKEKEIHRKICLMEFDINKSNLKFFEEYLIKLTKQNAEKEIFEHNKFAKFISYLWFKICYNMSPLGRYIIKKYRASPLKHQSEISFEKELVLRASALFKKKFY